MTKKRILRVKQQTVRTQEPRLMNDIINDLLHGQTPFARARRHRSGRAWTSQAGAGALARAAHTLVRQAREAHTLTRKALALAGRGRASTPTRSWTWT